MHSVRIELAKLILGTRITYQATGDAGGLIAYMYKIWTTAVVPQRVSP